MTFPADVAHELPYLRRYARALTGSQVRGDGYVRAALETLLKHPEQFPLDLEPKVALYRVFHMTWSGAHPAYGRDAVKSHANRNRIVQRIGALGPIRREALLLTSLEGFSTADAAAVLDLDPDEVGPIVENAVIDLATETPASVLIVEDEPIISMDLAGIIEEMGHSVAGVAVTRREAVAAMSKTSPDLVLADLQLADGTSGIDAVNDILSQVRVPIVYITAHSERLLDGAGAEPLFLVTKPFAAHSVKAAVGQALLLAEDQARHGAR
jgi:CheY-like chemotaxis protein/DNA-directed RNA polymerase specialized sigma24 family protein